MLWLIFIFVGIVFVSLILEWTVLNRWKKNSLYKRKTIIIEIILLSLIVGSGIWVHFPPNLEKTMETQPYLQITGKNQVTVCWTTNHESRSWVEYGTSESLGQKAFSVKDGLKDTGFFQKIPINNITLGAVYYYKVVSQPILTFNPYSVSYGEIEESQIYNFTLPTTEETISFLALADMHEHTELYPALLGLGANASYDTLFLNGDELSDLESHDQVIENLLQPLNKNFGSNIPFVYVRGNHETRGKYARQFHNYLATPTGNFYYSFDLGNVHFIILDGGEDKADSNKEYSGLVDFEAYRIEETAWLEKEVESPSYLAAKFRIVFIHIPLLEYLSANLTAKPYLQYQKVWAELLNATGTDLMISGHEHTNEIRDPNSTKNPYDFPVVIHGGYENNDQSVLRCDISGSTLGLSIQFNNSTFPTQQLTITANN